MAAKNRTNFETPFSADTAFLLTTAVAQLRLALDLIDRSGDEVAGAQLQMVIDAIAA